MDIFKWGNFCKNCFQFLKQKSNFRFRTGLWQRNLQVQNHLYYISVLYLTLLRH
jgi:hypothetical protein